MNNGLNATYSRDYARELFSGESLIDDDVPVQEALINHPPVAGDTKGAAESGEELLIFGDPNNPGPEQEGWEAPADSESTLLEDSAGYESRLPYNDQLQDFSEDPYQRDTVNSFPGDHSYHNVNLEGSVQGGFVPHTLPEETFVADQSPETLYVNPNNKEEPLEGDQTLPVSGVPQTHESLSQPPFFEETGVVPDHDESLPTQDETHTPEHDEIEASFRELPAETGYKSPQLLEGEADGKFLLGEPAHFTPGEEETSHLSAIDGETFVEDEANEPPGSFHEQQGNPPHEPSQPNFEPLYPPHQPFSGEFSQLVNSPSLPDSEQTPSSQPSRQEANQDHSGNHEALETVVNNEAHDGKPQENLKTIEPVVPIIDYLDAPVTPTTTTTAPTISRASRPRGSTRFSYTRRPFTRRPLSSRPTTTTRRTGSPPSPRADPPVASSFHSRLQKWRSSRIPQYESLRTRAVKENLDTEEGDQEATGREENISELPTRPGILPYQQFPSPQQYADSTPTLKTSRIDEGFPQEFFKEQVEPLTGEDSEPAPSELFPVHIRAPPTIQQARWRRPETRMYRRDFLRDVQEMQRTHDVRRTAHHDDTSAPRQVGDDNTDTLDSSKAEAPLLQHDLEKLDHSPPDYGSSDYQPHPTNYPS